MLFFPFSFPPQCQSSLLLASRATIVWQCVTSFNLSQLLQIHEMDSLQTLQCKTGIRYRPHDLQEVFIWLPSEKYVFEHYCITILIVCMYVYYSQSCALVTIKV